MSAMTLMMACDYVKRHRHVLDDMLLHDDVTRALNRDDYFRLCDEISLDLPHPKFAGMIRDFRHYHLLRLLYREHVGYADVISSMRAWSHIADALILRVLDYLKNQDKACRIEVMAMGKLGGLELNFSSDIDLIFVSEDRRHEDIRVIQRFIALMQEPLDNGFVFRVDVRLRPFGDSGPLVVSLPALSAYYHDEGRDWERYAMVKARVINRDLSLVPEWFQELIIPFVYRRYIDYGALEALRTMKAMIAREVKINPRLDDLKRGQGGIREIEFIVQNVQLMRGGRLPELQTTSTLDALDLLKKAHLLQYPRLLKRAYLFLRRLENWIQAQNDQQLHVLPDDALKQEQLCLALGYERWSDLLAHLNLCQRVVARVFNNILKKPDEEDETSQASLQKQLLLIWHGQVESVMATNFLADFGYDEAPTCYQLLHDFRHGSRCRRLSQAARMRLDRFMPLLLQLLPEYGDTARLLLRMIQLLEQVVGRSAYLALLTENPSALNELLQDFKKSPFIANLLVAQPFLLEAFLDEPLRRRLLSKDALKEKLLSEIKNTMDDEAVQEILRQFKLYHMLLIAKAELDGQISAIKAGRRLSDLAAVIIEVVIFICQSRFHGRFLHLMNDFAVIAYGKLGSQDMNYDSDLDLVFVHRVAIGQEPELMRLVQKILHMLTIRTASGPLYSVDTRLRPSGSAGLLISHMDAFRDYQLHQAWTWEHQAMVRARVIYGASIFKQSLQGIKEAIILNPKPTLKEDITEMRKKMQQHQSSDDVKTIPGGLIDLEFSIQYEVLSSNCTKLSRYTNGLVLLRQLHLLQKIDINRYKSDTARYRELHRALHRQVLF